MSWKVADKLRAAACTVAALWQILAHDQQLVWSPHPHTIRVKDLVGLRHDPCGDERLVLAGLTTSVVCTVRDATDPGLPALTSTRLR